MNTIYNQTKFDYLLNTFDQRIIKETKDLMHRLEISFWAKAIPIMSQSQVLHNIIDKTYDLIDYSTSNNIRLSALYWSLAGIFLGFILGLVTGFLK